MQTFRLFVSSPSDVMVERRRVENVASRLNGEFAGVARLDVIRWGTKNYQAFSTFQAQIPRSVDCDLVIGILKWPSWMSATKIAIHTKSLAKREPTLRIDTDVRSGSVISRSGPRRRR
jgi:hypothetical protein